MTINSKFKSLVAVALLSGFGMSSFSGFAAQSAQENNSLAPEISTADAKLSFRDIPDLKNAFIDLKRVRF